MGWTPLYLQMENKHVLIIGTGEVGSRRASRFLEAGANVIMLGTGIIDKLKKQGAILKPVHELNEWVQWSDIVVVASGDGVLNEKVSKIASDKLLNRADYPDEGNLIVPSTFFVGDVQISIFTGGKSPLMARKLREKIQEIIKEEDILQLEIQDFTRSLLKRKFDDQKKRRDYLYSVLDDENVSKFLEDRNLDGAKKYIERLINGV